MCEPCKVVIDGENMATAEMADKLAGIARGMVTRSGDAAADDALYEIACIEVEHILGIRQQALAMAKRVGAPDRWMKLMEQLYGA